MEQQNLYYCLCNHWTECGIGSAFSKGWYRDVWYERCFSSVYTIETTLNAADRYPGLKVCLELDSYTYEVLQEVSPSTLQRLKRYIQAGKAAVEGGTYGQPLGQDYSGESNIAHLVYGKCVIQELLDVDIKVFLAEEQWFHPQLPQLLKQSGFSYASLQCQNSGQVESGTEDVFLWKGMDGTVVPTIPANRNMVSCVKQYKGYDHLWKHLQKQKAPLLFQWAEVWVPGMDWGASLQPFAAGMTDAFRHGAKSVGLQEYFELTSEQALKTRYLSMDTSHYANDWYQNGGWGYDGDRILYENKYCENWLLAWEAKRFYEHCDDDEARDRYWKRLMILQNHDVSVARGYRAVDMYGVCSDANSLFIKSLRQLKEELRSLCFQQQTDLTLVSYNGAQGNITYTLPYQGDTMHVYDERHQELAVSMDKRHDSMYVAVAMRPYQTARLTFENGKEHEARLHKGRVVSFENIRITYEKGWCVYIEEQSSHTGIRYCAFSGDIGKCNEHDDHFHALSSAHHQFTFAFDGYRHCADQCSEMYVELEGIEEDDLFITMTLSCDLLTLHTTETPVAFAKSEIRLNKVTKEILTRSYLYCGVRLNMDAYATFTYDDNGPSALYRNFPFGEEKTELSAFYALDYVRVCNEQTGFTIMNYGNQRVYHDGQKLRFKLAKGVLLYDYEFQFSICFNTQTPLDSLQFLKRNQLMPLPVTEQKAIHIDCPQIQASSIFRMNRADHFRFINYSKHPVSCRIILPQVYADIKICDFLDQPQASCMQASDLSIEVSFQPAEIVTIAAFE